MRFSIRLNESGDNLFYNLEGAKIECVVNSVLLTHTSHWVGPVPKSLCNVVPREWSQQGVIWVQKKEQLELEELGLQRLQSEGGSAGVPGSLESVAGEWGAEGLGCPQIKMSVGCLCPDETVLPTCGSLLLQIEGCERWIRHPGCWACWTVESGPGHVLSWISKLHINDFG